MASTSVSNPSCIVEVGEEYPYGPSNNFPYPSHNFTNINILTIKLSGMDVYHVWKKQMLCLLTSQDMLGFIDGQFLRPSDRNGKAKDEDMKAWIRSDSLVTGWILGSLSEETTIMVVNRLTSEHKNADFSAKDAWDLLEFMYGPYELSAKDAWDLLQCMCGPYELGAKEANSMPEDAKSLDEADRKSLYRFILLGKSEKAYDKLRELELTPMDIITSDGNTSLHVAVSTKNQELLEKLLDMIRPEENSKLSNMQNLDGSTPLHIAAIVGNTEAADVLVQRYPKMLFIKDKKGQTPLDISLSNKHIKISRRLLEYIEKYEENLTKFSGTSGDELLILAISSKNFSLSLKLVRLYESIHNSEAVLMAIAQNFPSELSFWERRDQEIDYHAWEVKHRRLIMSCGPSGAVISKLIIFGISKIHMVSVKIIKKIVSQFRKERLQTHEDAIELLWEVFAKIYKKRGFNSLPQDYTNPVFGATRLNAFEVVTHIVRYDPNAIWSINEDGLNFIQYAVTNRSEKIYNLLYKSKRIYKLSEHKDPYGNNLLHLAGKLAPPHKLNLISGAVLQIQRELQWFKEVEEFVGPTKRMEKNYAGETPEMVFAREHMDLMIEGEKWMRATAEQCMIIAPHIITIVLAAITVPGGNNQDTGIPIHNNNIAFTVFGASIAISLFYAISSLLMCLSIFTTRFSAEDFLYKLPTKLIIGLAALIISTSAMIIAFGATLFLVFGHDNSWILIPIGVLTVLPITCFVTLQFPLIADLTRATYGRSIFDKSKPDEYFY